MGVGSGPGEERPCPRRTGPRPGNLPDATGQVPANPLAARYLRYSPIREGVVQHLLTLFRQPKGGRISSSQSQSAARRADAGDGGNGAATRGPVEPPPG